MSNNFVNAIEKEIAWKLTENGLNALNTTFDKCLDLFSTIGALRIRSDADIQDKFAAAYQESPLTAMKILFYARDINEGLGERRIFRLGLDWLVRFHPEHLYLNIANIVKYGRWDDLYTLVNKGNKALDAAVFDFIAHQWNADLTALSQGKPVSLMAKWLKSVNTSSQASNELGRLTAKALYLSERNYRKALALLRKQINVVETQMSQNEWSAIDFNKVPGGAMKKYIKAFYNHEGERYRVYLDAVNNGKKIVVNGKEVEAKINTKNLFPYEIVEKYLVNSYSLRVRQLQPELEAMWKGLKDTIQGVECNNIVIADTSGSMSGRPMSCSVGLGIYFAERNTGPFHNRFMTFSSKPSWITLKDGMTLADKINSVPSIVENTNLEAAFDLILQTAVNNHLTQDDMPKMLTIITDMEFDSCVEDNSGWQNRGKMTFYDKMKIKYDVYGYTLPEVVFWNVCARQDTYHATAHKKGVRMVSGQATNVFKSLIDGKTHTPYDFMLEVVYADRYDSVVIAQ